jgi:NAD+ kinase
MLKPKVLVVYKESAYSRFLSTKKLTQNLRKSDYWHILQGSHRRHHGTLMGVREILEAEGLRATLVLRNHVHRLSRVDEKFDLVISVGGDGTLLDSSHHVRKIPVLGVNSDPQRSVARFSGCDITTFPNVLRDYLLRKIKPVLVPRLEFFVNGLKNKWLVLNDLLVAAVSPAGTSRYVLKVGLEEEEQISSGVWISTAAGSTAAIFSAGGKKLPVSSRNYQYRVREIYQKKFGVRRLLGGILKPSQSLEIVSYMREGRIFIDGTNLVAPFRLGDKLKARLSSHPLKVIGLKG